MPRLDGIWHHKLHHDGAYLVAEGVNRFGIGNEMIKRTAWLTISAMSEAGLLVRRLEARPFRDLSRDV